MKYEAACSDSTWQSFEMLRYSASREVQILLTTSEENKNDEKRQKSTTHHSIQQAFSFVLPPILLPTQHFLDQSSPPTLKAGTKNVKTPPCRSSFESPT